MTPENWITISQMAEIPRISRQTLIFYDKINLFCPVQVEENGYRYYSCTQLPHLREICFLKSAGIKLEDIKRHFDARTPDSAIDLLRQRGEVLTQELERLNKMQASIARRIARYERALAHREQADRPYIARLPRREVLFFPWGEGEVSQQRLHLTMMKAWILHEQYTDLPPSNWGAILRGGALNTGQPLTGGGNYVEFGGGKLSQEDAEHLMILEEGEYACMYKRGMPYEPEGVRRLAGWIAEEGYEIAGDAADECLLDATFYDEAEGTDFSHLTIPVRRK